MQNTNQRVQKISLAERKFSWVKNTLRKVRNNVSREDQVEIAHLMKSIQDYGFSFFPNHYVFDQIQQLESILSKY